MLLGIDNAPTDQLDLLRVARFTSDVASTEKPCRGDTNFGRRRRGEAAGRRRQRVGEPTGLVPLNLLCECVAQVLQEVPLYFSPDHPWIDGLPDMLGRSNAQHAEGAMLMDYKVPSALTAPLEMHPPIIERPEPSRPFGSDGVGESGLIGAPALIANAVTKAGKRVGRLPMTPERVLDVLIGES